MMIPTVLLGEDVAYKPFSNPEAALRELQLTRVLSASLVECIDSYSEGLRHVLVFRLATPLYKVPPSLVTGLALFADVIGGMSTLSESFDVLHVAVCPRHVMLEDGRWKLIDSKHIVPIGAPLWMAPGMQEGFTCSDAILGGQNLQSRHSHYSVAVTTLWAIRRMVSFRTTKDRLYVEGKALLQNGPADKARSIWKLQDADAFLLPLLIGGFEQAVVDALRKRPPNPPPPSLMEVAGQVTDAPPNPPPPSPPTRGSPNEVADASPNPPPPSPPPHGRRTRGRGRLAEPASALPP